MDTTIFGVAPSYEDVIREDLNRYRHFVNEAFEKVQKLEEEVSDVELFYESTKDFKIKGREKLLAGTKRPLQREPTAAEEMQDVMRQFFKIINEITQHKNAWPFLNPVDFEGLRLYDYCEIIKKPMDFSTIKKKKREGRDGSAGYKNVREIYADVRLIFKNAMRYNDEKHEIHGMAKTLLEKIEKKWQQLLPKVAKAESLQLKEEADELLDKHIAKEATYAHRARELGVALSNVDLDLKNLKAILIGKCRTLSAAEKVKLGTALTKLSPENLAGALNILSENNPNFQCQPDAEMVNLDIDAQSDYTLSRLNIFVKNALEVQEKTGEGATVDHNDNIIEDRENNAKRRRVS